MVIEPVRVEPGGVLSNAWIPSVLYILGFNGNVGDMLNLNKAVPIVVKGFTKAQPGDILDAG